MHVCRYKKGGYPPLLFAIAFTAMDSETSSVISHSSTVFTRSEVGGSDSVSSEGSGKVRAKCLFLTYSRCTILEKDEFETRFVEMLTNSKIDYLGYYGCREHHDDGGIHYHVLLQLSRQPNWRMDLARAKLMVPGNECK